MNLFKFFRLTSMSLFTASVLACGGPMDEGVEEAEGEVTYHATAPDYTASVAPVTCANAERDAFAVLSGVAAVASGPDQNDIEGSCSSFVADFRINANLPVPYGRSNSIVPDFGLRDEVLRFLPQKECEGLLVTVNSYLGDFARTQTLGFKWYPSNDEANYPDFTWCVVDPSKSSGSLMTASVSSVAKTLRVAVKARSTWTNSSGQYFIKKYPVEALAVFEP